MVVWTEPDFAFPSFVEFITFRDSLDTQSFTLFYFEGLGMYETPLFLAHEEESGGRSVPTTPLQVAAPGMKPN